MGWNQCVFIVGDERFDVEIETNLKKAGFPPETIGDFGLRDLTGLIINESWIQGRIEIEGRERNVTISYIDGLNLYLGSWIE